MNYEQGIWEKERSVTQFFCKTITKYSISLDLSLNKYYFNE